MTQDFEGGAVRYEGDRPVAVGDLRLATPTRMASTSAGFWGLYELGDQVLVVHPAGAIRGSAGEIRSRLEAIAGADDRDGVDREIARSFLPLLGGDDPGAASDVPRSQVEQGPPASYTLSDERNAPPAPEPPDTPGARRPRR